MNINIFVSHPQANNEPIYHVYRNMMTSSNGNIFSVTGHLCGEFTGEFLAQRPATRNFDVFFDLRLNGRFSQHWWGWWFETPSRLSYRHSNENSMPVDGLTIWGGKASSSIPNNKGPFYKCSLFVTRAFISNGWQNEYPNWFIWRPRFVIQWISPW